MFRNRHQPAVSVTAEVAVDDIPRFRLRYPNPSAATFAAKSLFEGLMRIPWDETTIGQSIRAHVASGDGARGHED
jgi:hypothetical protein